MSSNIPLWEFPVTKIFFMQTESESQKNEVKIEVFALDFEIIPSGRHDAVTSSRLRLNRY